MQETTATHGASACVGVFVFILAFDKRMHLYPGEFAVQKGVDVAKIHI